MSRKPPAYRLHKPTGLAVVRLAGKDHYLGKHGSPSSYAKYDILIADYLANGRTPAKAILTVGNLSVRYLQFANSYYVKDGKPTDEVASIKAVLAVLLTRGELPVTAFTPKELKHIRSKMVVNRNSRKYINKQVARIKRMFKWGVENELVDVATWQALTAVAGLKEGRSDAKETAPVEPIADDIIEATIAHCSPTVAAMIRFQLLTGCRPGEARNIKADEIDMTGDVWTYTPGRHKTQHQGKARFIFIGPKAQAALAPFLDTTNKCRRLFTRPGGKPFERWHYADAINRACDKAFPAPKCLTTEAVKAWRKRHRWAPNRLRHSRGTELRQRFGLDVAKAVLGHSKVETTQIYAEQDKQKARDVMGEIG